MINEVELPIDPSTGVFFTPVLLLRNKEYTPAYCVPCSIKIYSAPEPIKFRYVTYRMKYMEPNGQLDPSTLISDSEIYQHPLTGHKTFSFKIKAKSISLNELVRECRRHFLSHLLDRTPSIIRKEAFNRVVAFSKKVKTQIANQVIDNIHHIESIDHDSDDVVFITKTSAIRFNLDGKLTTVNSTYTTNKNIDSELIAILKV